MQRADWEPFLKAAMERSPVCIDATKEMADASVIAALAALPNESIYDATRVAQPDEVWNYQRGDGLERALTLAAILKARHPEATFRLASDGSTVRLTTPAGEIRWPTLKSLAPDFAL